MANTTLKALTAISGTTLDNADLFLTHDFSANTEYKISLTDLRTAVGNVGTGSFTVTSSGTSDALVVTSTDATNTGAPDIVFYRNSASPAVSDIMGDIIFRGNNSANIATRYASISSSIVSPTSGLITNNENQNFNCSFSDFAIKYMDNINVNISAEQS